MIRKKNWLKLIVITVLTVALVLFLIYKKYIDINNIIVMGDDYQYNAISLSSIIGGFLFTGIGILISAIDKERIKRLWEHNYLDNLYRSSFGGILCNVFTIILTFAYLCLTLSEKIKIIIICCQTILIVLGLVYFIWCVKQLLFILKRMKDGK
ncbi:MAG: hypothetical protein UHM85_10005 [Acutalibacteraceae bacterium]|nr:hypothetical protein [Acutalibacteraceae bacterium]